MSRETIARNAGELINTPGYVFLKPSTLNTEFLRKGDWVGYSGHISMVYSEKPDPDGDFEIIHAWGPSGDVFEDDDDPETDPVFGRMVIVTDHEVETANAYGRIRLWD